MDGRELVVLVGKRIRRYRELKGITQVELGRRAGAGSIPAYERGEQPMSIDKLPAIAAALDVTVQMLVRPASDEPHDPTAEVLHAIVESMGHAEREKLLSMVRLMQSEA